jgi:hypothetical protein
MVHSKKILVAFFLIIIYYLYSYYIKTDIYAISYPKANDWNVDFIYGFHPKSHKKFVISNPPKEQLDLLGFVIENLPNLYHKYYSPTNKLEGLKSIERTSNFTLYEEKWFLNRFFTTLYLDDVTINEAVQHKYGKECWDSMSKIYVNFLEHNPYIVLDQKTAKLVYFPDGNPKYSKNHWYIHYYYHPNTGKPYSRFIPASYSPIDSLKGKVANYQELVIPHELKDPKNKERWKNVARE